MGVGMGVGWKGLGGRCEDVEVEVEGKRWESSVGVGILNEGYGR